MIKKLTSLSRKSKLLILVILAVIFGLYIVTQKSSVNTDKLTEYVSFSNNVVYKVPGTLSVDSQTLLGVELMYAVPITAKTVEDVYSQNGIAIQSINLTDHSSKGFKDYTNSILLPDLKKNLSTNDVTVKYSKSNGLDNASITAKKSGQVIRFIFFKGGQHPVIVVSKQETANSKIINQTLNDIENSDLKNEITAIKTAMKNVIEQAKSQKAQDIYNNSNTELQKQSSVAQLTSALQKASSFLGQNVEVSGGGYKDNTFSSVMRFTPIGQDNPQSSFGTIILKKSASSWQLQGLTLPTPKQ